MKSRIVVLFFIVFLWQHAKSQDFSNKGVDFWVAYSGHIDATNSAMGIYITSDVNASGEIKVGNTVIPFTVTANSVTRKFIGPNATGDAPNTSVYLSTQDGIQAGAGIRITSDKPVAVYSHIIRSARSAATLVLPTKVWGKKYIVPSYKNVGNAGNESGYGELAVMASEANTKVRITPSVASRSGTRAPGVPFEINLPNAGDVYQVQFAKNADISGTKVESVADSTGGGCKPITVFSATTWSAFDCTSPISSGGDNLYQQLFPTGAWGKQFVVAPFKNRLYDIVRVFVDDSSTVVTKTENGVKSTLTGIVNRYYEFKTSNPVLIEADKPVSLAQYMVSQTCDTRNGICGGNNQPACPFPADPEMVVINPVEQTISNITVFSAHRNFVPPSQSAVTQCFLNVIIKNSAISSFKINNQPPGGTFIPIPSTSYSYLQEDVTSITLSNPVQTLTADSGFIAVAYGYGQVESYGYNAGTNVKDLYQYITLDNQYAVVNEPVTCKNTPFFFSITLPYKPTSITWNFNNTSNLSPNANFTNNDPVPDSTFIKDGKTLYTFKQKTNSYVFSATGIYPVKVLVNNQTAEGCPGIQEITYDVNVYDPPVADFSLSHSGCASDTTLFRDATNGNNRPVVKWKWDFGDGTVDSVKNPKKVYNEPGKFNVKLFTITDAGCISEVIKPVAITTKPQASFTHSTSCVGTEITFTDASTQASGSNIKWLWNFGEGSPVINNTNTPVSHTYNQPGKYNATLQIETSTGCKSTVFNKIVDVTSKPVANIILPEVCLNDAFAQFTDSSFFADGSQGAFSYQWNFGDNNSTAGSPNTSNEKNPRHKYSAVGTYTVAMKVTSKDGCSSTIAKDFTVNGSIPQASFNVLNSSALCSNTKVEIQNTSTVDFGAITKVEIIWDAGGTPSVIFIDDNPHPNKIYSNFYPSLATSKDYQIKLKAYSGGTCINETIKSITVNASPKVVFTPVPDVCSDANAFQVSQASETNGVAGSFSFSGKGISSAGLFNSSLAGVGQTQIKYTYTSNAGCKDSATQIIMVLANPKVNAGPDLFILEGGSSTINATATGNNVTYMWNPATYLNNASILTPRITPLADITYKLTVTATDGCTASDQVFVKVLLSPTIPNAFSPNRDGINDTWNIEYIESYPGATIEVFNRYGQIVFKSVGYTKPWNGTYNGIELPVGVYYYIVNPNNGRKLLTGSVTILK